MNKIILKLYSAPTAIGTIAFLVFQWSDSLLQNMQQIGNNPFDIFFQEITFKYFIYVPLMSGAAIIFSSFWLLLSTYKLWKIERGELHIYDECCPICGAITIRKIGRYGAYMKCLTCGKNTGI